VADDSPIDAYLATLPASQRDALQHLRSQILQLAPDAVETISYGMPTFKLRGRALVSFAGWKAHCSIYPLTGTLLDAHADALKGYERTIGERPFHAREAVAGAARRGTHPLAPRRSRRG